MAKRFLRSRTDRMLGGVCGGLGTYLDVDTTVVRLVFVVLAVATGVGVLAYFVLWLIVPEEEKADATPAETVKSGAGEIADRTREMGTEIARAARRFPSAPTVLVGLTLVVVGAALLLHNLGIRWLTWLRFGVVGSALLIIIGVALLWRRAKGDGDA